MVAFTAGDGATLVVVIRNGDTAGAAAKSFTFDLTAVPVVGAQVGRVPHVADREPGVARRDPGAELELHGQRPRLFADHAGHPASLSGYFFAGAAALLGLSAGFR